jgi:hypothetical protein
MSAQEDSPKALRLDEVRGFEYVEPEVPNMPPGEAWDWGFGMGDDGVTRTSRTPLVPCVRCGRLTEDPTRGTFGIPLPDYEFDSEDDKEPLCFDCREEEERKDTETRVLELLERKLGLRERDRDALRSFIETIFTDPKKILKVQELDNRVAGLEGQTTALWIALGIVGTLLAIVAAIALGG